MQVIAIVTDQLTDSAIISDLHRAASRGVPVYIILNQRSIQENFTLNRLRHPVSHLLNEHTPRTHPRVHFCHSSDNTREFVHSKPSRTNPSCQQILQLVTITYESNILAIES